MHNHKASGGHRKDANRRVTVIKPRGQGKDADIVYGLNFSQHSVQALNSYFQVSCPPNLPYAVT